MRTTTKILVVEDEDAVRDMICTMLAQCGYEILPARNGEEAIRLWEANQQCIRLVLTDVIMPGIGGTELARRIKAVQPETVVLLMSGYSDGPLHDPGEVACGFLPKPFTAVALTEAVRGALQPDA